MLRDEVSPRGMGCVAAVACRGSCGTGSCRCRRAARRPCDRGYRPNPSCSAARCLCGSGRRSSRSKARRGSGCRSPRYRDGPVGSASGIRRSRSTATIDDVNRLSPRERPVEIGPGSPSRNRGARARGRRPASARRCRRRPATVRCPAARFRGQVRRGPGIVPNVQVSLPRGVESLHASADAELGTRETR